MNPHHPHGDPHRHHPAYGYGAQPPAPRNGLGTAGFVLGLIGLLFAFVPIVGVIAWPLVLVGLPMSIVGYLRARRREATNGGLALAGIICSTIGLAVCVAYAAAFAAVDTPEFAGPPPELGYGQADPSLSTPATGGASGPPPPPPVFGPAPPPEAGGITSGTYLVGIDIEPGRYRTTGPEQGAIPYCYWARLSSTDGGLDSIIANNGGDGSAVVTVKASDDAFETYGCATWERVR